MVTHSKLKRFTMKASLYILALLLAYLSFLAGCGKDIREYAPESALEAMAAVSKHHAHERPLKATMDMYQVYTPDVANGGCYCPPYLPGYMTGTGEGHSTLLGKFYGYINLYSYYGATGAQVTYSVPLPADCYEQLTPWFTEEEMEAIREQGVEVIFFDRQGNAIWSVIDTLYLVPSPANALYFSLAGTGRITGGTGKFAGTTSGVYDFYGYSEVFRSSAPGVPYQYSWLHMEGRMEYGEGIRD